MPIAQTHHLIPNWSIQDHAGQSYSVWDFRQKSHLVLIYDPEASHETVQRWEAAIQADARQWDWLRVKLILVKNAPADMAPGVYTVDRYGTLLTPWPLTSWNFESLEKEFLYYEARHC